MNKIFEVDWDDVESIHKLRQKLTARERILTQQGRPTKFDLAKEVYDSIQNILTSDISFLYEGKYSNERDYYVYGHLNPLRKIVLNKNRPMAKLSFAASLGMTHTPFYIGKGKGDRAYLLNRNGTHTKVKEFVSKFGVTPIPFIIKDSLLEKEAFILEDKLIDIFGLQCYGGFLTNLDEGNSPPQRRYLYKEDFQKIHPKYGKGLLFEKRIPEKIVSVSGV